MITFLLGVAVGFIIAILNFIFLAFNENARQGRPITSLFLCKNRRASRPTIPDQNLTIQTN